jgi:Helix-loop-helix DNA-binding domain
MSLSMNPSNPAAYGGGGADGLYYRYYPSPPQHDFYSGGGGGGAAWADCSPPSSGRSVSPCDEYQPPVGDFLPMTAPLMAPRAAPPGVPGAPRVVKRRCTANKKERRRTQSINTAFSSLREHIPGIPGDTKLSKIKTLKHAIAYINHLMEMLSGDKISIDTARSAFRADLQVVGRRGASRHHLGSHLHNDLGVDHHDHNQFARRCAEVSL